MDLVREFFRSKSLAQLVMIAAILLLFVSQFFYYFDDKGTAVLGNMTNLDYYTTLDFISFDRIGTGWELHPHAYVILVLLAFAFLRDDILDHPLFQRWGWWVSLILVFAAIIPGAPMRATGAGMGGIAFLIAIAAVVLHRRERKAAKAAGTDTPAA